MPIRIVPGVDATVVPSAAERLAAALARWRGGRVLHPAGRSFLGAVTVWGLPGDPTGVPLLDRPGRYPATVRFSKGVPTPAGWPDVLGLGVRVHPATARTPEPDPHTGARPFDLLVSSSGTAPVLRCLPLPRRRFTGPYSTIMSYRAGRRRLWLAALPAPDAADLGVRLTEVAATAGTDDARLVLAVASAFGRWRPFGEVRIGTPLDGPADAALAFDPVGNLPTRLRAVGPVARLRAPAYRGSQRGRGAVGQSGGSTGVTV